MREATVFLMFMLLALLALGGCQPLVAPESEAAQKEAEFTGEVFEVLPTGDPTQDITNIQAAIDAVSDGDTVLLKQGAFDFGDWKTNPPYTGFIVINKGITVTGDGFNGDGSPKTVIRGGGFRHKNHWDQSEHGVVNFGGNASGGVLENVWLKDPHFYGIFITGFKGESHEDITVRNVWVTDISADIPEWAQNTAVGRSIDMGATVPDWNVYGPVGTVTIENNTISDRNSALDAAFLDPDTGEPYYVGPDGEALSYGTQGYHGIGLWINMDADLVVRGNTVHSQHEGIVLECMSGHGDILVDGNEIMVETVSLGPDLQRGIRVTTCDPEGFPYPSERTVRVENNRIQVVGSAAEGAVTEGMILSNDNGLDGFAATYTVIGNEIDIQDGHAAIVLGSEVPVAALRDAEIRDNVLRGTADYGIYAMKGAEHCMVEDNDMAELEAGVAEVELASEGI